MRDLNIDYVDLYKSIDGFIRDAYSSAEGVSEYIRQMEANDYIGRQTITTWKDDYALLKHARWLRNQLAHEVGFDSDICEEDDYDYLEDFRERLFSGEDPMAKLNKSQESHRQRQAPRTAAQPLPNRIPMKRESVLARIIRFFWH